MIMAMGLRPLALPTCCANSWCCTMVLFDTRVQVKAYREALPAGPQAAVFLLEPSKCALGLEAGNHFFDRSATRPETADDAPACACLLHATGSPSHATSLPVASKTLRPVRCLHAYLTTTISITYLSGTALALLIRQHTKTTRSPRAC